MSALRPMVESSFIDLESRNPGLEFRLHWISRMGYGRDRRLGKMRQVRDGCMQG